MKKCPYCLSEVSEKAKKCKCCWERLEEKGKEKEKYRDKKINWITSSVWRLIIVLYFFITIPAFFVILYFIWDNYWPSYFYGYIPREWWPTIIRTILLPIIYIILTDILRGAIYYITTWKYELYIWEKIKPFIKKLINWF